MSYQIPTPYKQTLDTVLSDLDGEIEKLQPKFA